MTRTPRPSRRAVLTGGLSAAAAVLAACARDTAGGGAPSTTRSPSAPTTTTPAAPTTSPPTALAASPGPAGFVVRGPADSRSVALTFHTDGDLGIARELLDVLAAHDAVGTCFIVGDWLVANPDWAGALTGAGLELANHTQTHPAFGRLSPEQMAEEVARCRDVLIDLTGEQGRFFRPSGTADGTAPPPSAVLALAGEAGYPLVLGWDVDPLDYQDPGGEVIEERVLAGVTGGSVVSLHFGHAGTVAALGPILSGLEQRGLRTVTASELLG